MRRFRSPLAALALPVVLLFAGPRMAAGCDKTGHIYQSVIDENPFISSLWERDATEAERTILELKMMALDDKKKEDAAEHPDSQAYTPAAQPTPEEKQLMDQNPLLLKAYEHNPEAMLDLLKRIRNSRK